MCSAGLCFSVWWSWVGPCPNGGAREGPVLLSEAVCAAAFASDLRSAASLAQNGKQNAGFPRASKLLLNNTLCLHALECNVVFQCCPINAVHDLATAC